MLCVSEPLELPCPDPLSITVSLVSNRYQQKPENNTGLGEPCPVGKDVEQHQRISRGWLCLDLRRCLLVPPGHH